MADNEANDTTLYIAASIAGLPIFIAAAGAAAWLRYMTVRAARVEMRAVNAALFQ